MNTILDKDTLSIIYDFSRDYTEEEMEEVYEELQEEIELYYDDEKHTLDINIGKNEIILNNVNEDFDDEDYNNGLSNLILEYHDFKNYINKYDFLHHSLYEEGEREDIEEIREKYSNDYDNMKLQHDLIKLVFIEEYNFSENDFELFNEIIISEL